MLNYVVELDVEYGDAIVAKALDLWWGHPHEEAVQILDRAMADYLGEDLDYAFEPCELRPPHPFAELLRQAFSPDLPPVLLFLAIESDDPELEEVRLEWHIALMRFAERYELWRSVH